MIFGVTELSTYKRCRRLFDLTSRNRQNLEPIAPVSALALGTFVHEALGKWVEDPTSRPAVTFMQAASAKRQEVIDVFYQQNGYSIDSAKLDKIDDAISMGFQMMKNYEEHWKSPLPADCTLIAQEQNVCMPIPGTEHTSEWFYDPQTDDLYEHVYPKPEPHYLRGRLDGIIKNAAGRLLVLEHKTYKNRPKLEVLNTTEQFVAYTWLLQQLPLDAPVLGVAYDGLWKRVQVPDRVDGRKGVMADLFSRVRIEHPPEVLAEFEAELCALALEIGNKPPVYKNRTSDGSCFWSCSMEPLCNAISRGEDTSFLMREEYRRKPDEEESDKEDES